MPRNRLPAMTKAEREDRLLSEFPSLPPRVATEIVESSTPRLIQMLHHLRPWRSKNFPNGCTYLAGISDAVRTEIRYREVADPDDNVTDQRFGGAS